MAQREDSKRSLIVHAVSDDGWCMGEDLVLHVTGAELLADIPALIAKQKQHISASRMVLHKAGDASPFPEKLYDWDLNRIGLYDNAVIDVHPVQPDSWLWMPLQYYLDAVFQQIQVIIEQNSSRVSMQQLAQEVSLPPPLQNGSLRSLLRQYPERFLMELDTSCDEQYVTLNTDASIPKSV